MIIRINENYRIAGDQQSWSIQQPRKRRDKKTGELKTVWESCSWFTSPEALVNYLGEMLVRTSDAQTLAEVLAETDRVTTMLSRALSPEFRVIRVIEQRGARLLEKRSARLAENVSLVNKT